MAAIPIFMTEYILIDMDYTLIDTGTHSEIATQKTFKSFDREVTVEEIAHCNNFTRLIESYGLKWKEFWDRFDNYDNREKGITLGSIKPFNDMERFFSMIKKIPTAIVSDTPDFKAELQMRRFGLDRFVEGIACKNCDDPLYKEKPDVNVGLRGLDILGFKMNTFDMNRIWVVGDTIAADMKLAENLQEYLTLKGDRSQVYGVYVARKKVNGELLEKIQEKKCFVTTGPEHLVSAARIILGQTSC